MNPHLNLELRQILDACAEMILICDSNGLIRYVNPPLCKSSGYDKDELIGLPVRVLDSPDDDSETRKQLSAALDKRESWHGRVLLRRNRCSTTLVPGGSPPIPLDHSQYWAEVTVSPIHDADNSLLGYVQIQRDIMDEIKSENRRIREASDNQARLQIARELAESTPLEDRLSRALEVLCELEGLGSQRCGGLFQICDERLHLIGLHGYFQDLCSHDAQLVSQLQSLCDRAANAAAVVVLDSCNCAPNPSHTKQIATRHGHYLVPLRYNGNNLGVLFLNTEVYPDRDPVREALFLQVGELVAMALLREEARSALTEARNQALLAAEAKTAFLANMSHEIRTPMNGVLGMLELLRDTDLSFEQRDLVETASGSAESLLEILNEILDFSKLESGKVEIESVPFDLAELAEETCAILAPRAHDKNIELNLDLPSGFASHRCGDPTRVRQVLTNLTGNAVKFTAVGEVTVTIRNRGERIRFEIRDTGIGIPENVLENLFQPFTQADTSTTRHFGGTGLGLAISKQLVVQMGGQIEVESSLGKGSVFRFEIPLPALDEKPERIPIELPGKRILIVDDNATNRRILNSHLSHLGLTVAESRDGAEALERLRQDPAFDLVILDYHMPNLDGAQLAEAMQADPVLATIPRILLSSGAQLGSDRQREIGIQVCLLKPIRRERLRRALIDTFQNDPIRIREPVRPSANPSWQGRNILVAEDNPVNQKVVSRHLTALGLSVEIVGNGAEALDKLANERYDLVLMDCQMPVMDGYQAIRTLRIQEREAQLPRTKVIALTAHAGEGEREKCLAAGMDDYLAKPITKQALLEILNRHLQSGSIELEQEPGKRVPLCDLDAALATLEGDRELLQDLIGLFLEDAPVRLETLERATENRDVASITDTAHALKGMLAHFHASSCGKLAATLEHNAKFGDSNQLDAQARQLIAAVRNIIADLEKRAEYA